MHHYELIITAMYLFTLLTIIVLLIAKGLAVKCLDHYFFLSKLNNVSKTVNNNKTIVAMFCQTAGYFVDKFTTSYCDEYYTARYCQSINALKEIINSNFSSLLSFLSFTQCSQTTQNIDIDCFDYVSDSNNKQETDQTKEDQTKEDAFSTNLLSSCLELFAALAKNKQSACDENKIPCNGNASHCPTGCQINKQPPCNENKTPCNGDASPCFTEYRREPENSTTSCAETHAHNTECSPGDCSQQSACCREMPLRDYIESFNRNKAAPSDEPNKEKLD